MKKEVLVIIPAYNEEANIHQVLEKLEEERVMEYADILVVNDASSDNTNYLAKKEACILVTHVFNLGYGAALRLGYRYAVRREYRYVIQMDADGQHDVCNVPRILEALKTKGEDGRYPDIVIGSRYVEGASPFDTPFLKRVAMGWFRRIIKGTTGEQIMDPTSGLQGLRFPAFLYYSRFGNFDNRYPDANMIIQMLLLKFRVKEIPAVMHTRKGGTSMHSGLKPLFYMAWMALSIVGVLIRYKVKRIDEGIGEKNAIIWKTEKESSEPDAEGV